MSLSADDRLAILDVITRADEAASRRDADGYVALFAPDAVLDGTQGRHAGREELRASVGPIWAAEGPATLHLTLNPVVELLYPFLADPVPGLLERHRRHGTAHAALIAEILNVLAGREPISDETRSLREPLSQAETRVLRYLPTKLSAPEIAGQPAPWACSHHPRAGPEP